MIEPEETGAGQSLVGSPQRDHMNTEPVNQEAAANQSTPDFDLGTWLGRREAFGIMAGKARGAEVEYIRKIRTRSYSSPRRRTGPLSGFGLRIGKYR